MTGTVAEVEIPCHRHQLVWPEDLGHAALWRVEELLVLLLRTPLPLGGLCPAIESEVDPIPTSPWRTTQPHRRATAHLQIEDLPGPFENGCRTPQSSHLVAFSSPSKRHSWARHACQTLSFHWCPPTPSAACWCRSVHLPGPGSPHFLSQDPHLSPLSGTPTLLAGIPRHVGVQRQIGEGATSQPDCTFWCFPRQVHSATNASHVGKLSMTVEIRPMLGLFPRPLRCLLCHCPPSRPPQGSP